jgi:hypothetical protein
LSCYELGGESRGSSEIFLKVLKEFDRMLFLNVLLVPYS